MQESKEYGVFDAVQLLVGDIAANKLADSNIIKSRGQPTVFKSSAHSSMQRKASGSKRQHESEDEYQEDEEDEEEDEDDIIMSDEEEMYVGKGKRRCLR